eukprot:TRINITY_DN22697_c0_g1_i5.p1 TRINITY_DN22697_c0_g1~~TRINITY_DN22697_c0_g1_i5.p1  ORF type:complete len:267 (+),score=40.07 TRINITY_DN22697_c0_g1_i5:91-891(+)
MSFESNSSNTSVVTATPNNMHVVAKASAHDVSSLVETSLAVLWCLMMGLSPFLLAYLKGETLSQRGRASSSLVMCWVIFGVITCKCVLFKSSHFEGNRNLTLGESVYFMSQIITTTGYGDVIPANHAGQALVAILVMWAVLIVADAVSQVASIMGDRLDRAVECTSKDPVSMQKTHLLAAVYGHFVVCAIWVAVLSLVYGWTVEASLFSSVVTSTTVGFGLYTPEQTGAQIFVAFWMLIGAASMVNVVSAFGGLMKALTDKCETDQ